VASLEILYRAGPFKAFNTRQADVYQDPGNATSCANADTHRLGGALSNFFGRAIYLTFPGLSTLESIARYDVGPQNPYWITMDADGRALTYDAFDNIFQSTTMPNGQWTNAVQCDGNIFFNNGQQMFATTGSPTPLDVALWQYPEPPEFNVSRTSQAQEPSGAFLPAGEYSYALAYVIALPSVNGTISQTTQARGTGGAFPFPHTVISNGSVSALITAPLSGTTPDGYPFTSTLYRFSENQPQWFLLASGLTGSSYLDVASDASLTANAEINLALQQPPVGPNQINPIEEYQDRMWVLARVTSAATNNVPQTQLWYSNVGQPWAFDGTNQVLLVGNEFTLPIGNTNSAFTPTLGPNDTTYGDEPVALCRLGSQLLVFKTQSTWMVVGSDQVSYTAIPLFSDLGCIAPGSVCKGNGVVFWLSAQGVYAYDGSNLTYLSDPIYNVLQQGQGVLSAAQGGYCDLTYFLTDPAAGQTYAMYLPTKEWTILPYVSSFFVNDTSVLDAPGSDVGFFKFNQLMGGASNQLVSFTAGGENDLGAGTAVSWTGPIWESGQPWTEKDYQWVSLSAPVQSSSVIATVTTVFNPGSPTAPPPAVSTFDLSQGPMQNQHLPQGSRGYAIQMTVQFITPVNANGPVSIYSIAYGGTFARPWTQPS
jgi:hypothetical protein